MDQRFTWVPTYEAIASKLLEYEAHQDELAEIVNAVIGEKYDKMDPPTFFSMFNGKLKNDAKRQAAVGKVIERLHIDVAVPNDFAGLPVTFGMQWRFWGGGVDDVVNNWAVSKAAIAYADNPGPDTKSEFVEAFDVSRTQHKMGHAKLTMALFWMRPQMYLPLDNNTTAYLKNRYGVSVKVPLDGEAYLLLLDTVRDKTTQSFVALSFAAWEKSGWIPAPSDYDPGITVQQWRELLSDPQIGTSGVLTALKCLNEQPKGATCTELSELYGRSAEYYNANISTLGQAVASKLGIAVREADGGKYWPIVCYGSYVRKRRHGTFEWRLRGAVREALNAIDLSGIHLREEVAKVAPAFNIARLERLLGLYKADFDKYRGANAPGGDQEIYKWNDLLAFRSAWDIDADDFVAMLTDALKPAATGDGSLLDNGYEHPFANLLKLAAYDPPAVREAFGLLFDPDSELRVTYGGFSRAMDDLLKRYDEEMDKPLGRDYQEPKAASVYLFFRYPERYHIYKYSFADAITEAMDASLSTDQLERFYQYEALCDALIPHIIADSDLIALNSSVLTAQQLQADVGYHLLLEDIAYYADKRMKKLHPNWRELLSGEEVIVGNGGKNALQKTIHYPKNLILYGPPGTGKTYRTKAYAVAICDGLDVKDVLERMRTEDGYRAISERYHQLEEEERIGFTTFHQSYGYEEFIEGLRPDIDDESETMRYKLSKGVFRKFCDVADNMVIDASVESGIPRYGGNPHPRVWKMGLTTGEVSDLLAICQTEGCLRMGWDDVPPEVVADSEDLSTMNRRAILAFQEEMQPGDFVVVPGVSSAEYGVAVITGEFEWRDSLKHAMRYRAARWLKNVDKAAFIELNGGRMLTLQTVYELKRVSASKLIEAMGLVSDHQRERQQSKPFVFIIDEINRGNISKIFGELITLLEEGKRKGAKEEATATLPYSGDRFSVPSNVYVIGTMNTADRSIALMDTALRRRFDFVEVMPDVSTLQGVEVEGIDIAKMLQAMNDRIELLYDREHTLGHAYLLPLKQAPTIEELRGIFQSRLLPLLQEYFFDDYAKIGSVLGAAAEEFIVVKRAEDVFWQGDNEVHDQLQGYRLKGAPLVTSAYAKIYQFTVPADDEE